MSQGYTSGVGKTNDPTLSGNSQFLVPTEYAVKTYVDTSISAIPTPDLEDVLTEGNDGGGIEITNIADGSADNSAATVGQVNDLGRLYVLDVNVGTSTHTGTTSETITWSFEVPANTIGLNDIIELKTMHRKTTGAAGAHNVRHYMNTSNVVGGGGAITLYNNAQGAAVTIMGETVVKWDNSTTNFVAKPSANAAWGVTSGTAPTTGSISTAASIWFQVTVQLATSTDVVTQYVVELIHHKYA